MEHLHKLHDHIDVIVSLNDLIKPDDVGVHEQPQDLDFSPHCAIHRPCSQFILAHLEISW